MAFAAGACYATGVRRHTVSTDQVYYRRQVDIDVGLNSSSRDETFLVCIPSFCVDFPMLRNHAHWVPFKEPISGTMYIPGKQ